MRGLLLATIALVCAAGCSTYGNQQVAAETQQSLAQKITIGQTTKDDVREHLGDPNTVNFTDSGNEQWLYVFNRTQIDAITYIPVVGLFSGADSELKQVTILFDTSGIVKNFNVSDTKSRTGLLN